MPDTKGEYPDGALATFTLVLAFGEHQPHRGRFRNKQVLSALLGRRARWISFLIEHGDLIQVDRNILYIDGWDEWQEGDWKVAERMKRVRERKKRALAVTPPDTVAVTPSVTPPVTVPTVTGLSEPLAVSGRPSAVGGRPLAESTHRDNALQEANGRSLDALLKQHDPDDDLGLQLAVRMTQLLGRDLAPMEVSMCSIFVDDFAYLSVDDMVERARSHMAHCKATKLPLPQKMHGFRETLRLQNDHVADSSGVKAWRPPPVAGDLSALHKEASR